tara:strand:+ start:572 stop:1387 length:816 start_codon:yes stop_codon:yes gene_type:complete
MNKWPKCNLCVLLRLCLCIFFLTSCSTIKLQRFISSLTSNQTENNIEKDSVPTTDDQINLSNDTLKKKNEKITEFRTSLNNLKTIVENKNKEISHLKKRFDRITHLNNSQTNQISRLKNELNQTKNSKQAQENEITRLRNELDQAINSRQARILEEIEESGFFEPQEIKNSNTTPVIIVIDKKPSFSCKGGLRWDEKAICNNPSLAEWDRKVSSAYKNALTSTHNNKAKNKLIAKHKKWLSTRYQCKEDYDKNLCLEKKIHKAIGFFERKK